MNELPLAFAFTAGVFATVNPCGWAMLPSFVSYYLGSNEEGYEQKPLAGRAAEGVYIGLLVTIGFLAIFGTPGVALSAGLRVVIKYMPFLALAVGLGLALLGLWLLAGKSLPLALPVPQLAFRARNPQSVFLFGVAYALASLGCTLPVFLAVIGASLTTTGLGTGAAMFGAYAAGMASVLMMVAVSMALLKGAIARWFRTLLPYVHRLGAMLLILAGVYLIWYQGQYLPLVLAGF
ncbi:MAG: cytochrome c biogenesis protein CcdA [Chloroflexi bacterium]|nr:cytochrome c biogenesis protein CcdA [Chloroflexota bacterium]